MGGSGESGASMAWQHVLCPLAPSEANRWGDFAKLCAIRDNWTKEDKAWEEACGLAAALSILAGPEILEEAGNGQVDIPSILSFGRKAYAQKKGKIGKLAGGCNKVILKVGEEEIRIGFFNCTEKLSSDVCDVLIEEMGCEAAVGWFFMEEEGEDQIVSSIRSKRGGKVSALMVAEDLGGGGHESAASFKVRQDSVADYISSVLRAVRRTAAAG